MYVIPLFARHPELDERVPYLRLGELPTPVERMRQLERETGARALYVKRDDVSGSAYGGNKLRKLEFILADARRAGAREVLTFGAAGSNHALATAIYARQLEMRCISMLVPQVSTPYLGRNLLGGLQAGAELHHYPDERNMQAAVRYQLLRHEAMTGRRPYVIAGGGSSPTGVLGFVNAALELAAQVEAGELPAPDLLYVAMGTVGTVAGLALGLDVAGLATRIVAARVVRADIGNLRRYQRLYREARALLDAGARSFTPPEPRPERLELRHEFFGDRYAQPTPECLRAIECARDTAGLELEGTYTGKAFAALLHDLERGTAGERVVLFWHTYNSRPFAHGVNELDYQRLPPAFWRYFEEAAAGGL